MNARLMVDRPIRPESRRLANLFVAGFHLALSITGVGLLVERPADAQPNCESAGAKSADRIARGPLQTHPQNGRYFTDDTKMPDGSLRAVYLTGSHTWGNLCD